ncbi:MAG: Gfo/Idh/MocA family oxidoreductase [Chloroflexi bacterium]|nr:Gfo/Idh/MocA family oxidoreductase [Chloroflexota bacterium]
MSLRFAIIGVGNIAPLHATAIQSIPAADLVAVCTRDETRGRAFADKFGGNYFSDYRAVLARDDVDVVALCTPHDLHAPMTIDAARAHKHILVEKPMARNVAECDAMIDAAKRAGVTLGVVFQMRFDPLVANLQSLISNRLGQLLWVSTTALWYRTDEYYRSGAWRGTWDREGGGVLINQGVHVIDLMLYLTGMPTRVTAQTRTLNHQIEVEDAALAILEYADNQLGLIQATVAAYPGYPERLEIVGARGSAIYHRGEARLEWHLADPRDDGETRGAVSSGASAPMNINAAGHIAQYHDFVAALRERRAPLIDGREGRKSIAVIEAIYRSAACGQRVEIGD